MFSCMWNGKRIDAFEVSKLEGSETQIRKAAASGELRCIDPNCECPKLGYKHGEKKSSHFYHYHNSNCGYTYFEKNDKPIIKAVRNALFDHFKIKGYNVERECRLPISGVFCHLLFIIDNKRIVLQIADKTTQVKDREKLQKACEENNYALKWIVVGDPNKNQDEYNNYHIHRYLLNNSMNNDLLIIDENAAMISQTKIFDNDLFFEHERYYRMAAPLDRLSFENGEITIECFYESFNRWFTDKVAEKERQRCEDEAWLKKQREESINRMLTLEEVSRRKARTIVSQFTSSVEDSFVDKYYSSKVEEPSYPPIDYSKYVVGARVKHGSYGIGTITELFRETQKVRIKFENGHEDNFRIENLARSSDFRFIES